MKTNLATLALLIFLSLSSFAQNGAHILISSGPCSPIIPLLCPSGVENPNNAVDNDITTYANMRTSIGLLSSSFLKMGFSTPAPGGYTVGILTEENTVLDVDVLATLTVSLYNSSGQQVATRSGLSLADVQVDAQHRGIIRIKVPNNKTAASVQLTVGGLLLLENDVKVYGAVYAPNNVAYYATYVYAEGPCDPIIPITCPGGVLNSGNSVDANKNNAATLTIPLGIGGNAYLDLGFTLPGTKGSTVYFTCGNVGLLDVALLANLHLTVYDVNGNVVKKKDGFALADVQVLSSNKFLVHLKTPNNGTYQIARARLTLDALVAISTDLNVYNAYYKGKTDFASYFPKMGEASALAASSDLNLYPNPAGNTLNVSMSSLSSTPASIQITNMLGATVYSGYMEPGVNNISTQNFESGIYMVIVNDNGTFINRKLIIEK